MKYFALLIAIFSARILSAQFSAEGNEWYVTESYSNASMDDPTAIGFLTDIFKIQGDTLIDSQLWKKVYVRSTEEGQGVLSGMVRDEGLQVHHRELSGIERIIYDYSMQEGDSYELPFCFSDVEVIGTGIVEINFEERITIEFEFLDNMACTYQDHWIEGIGSLNGPFNPLDPYLFSTELPFRRNLVCFYSETGEIPEWQNPDFPLCFTETLVGELATDVSIFPNPVYDRLSVSNRSVGRIKRVIVSDLYGKTVAFEDFPEGNLLEIDFSEIGSGFYIVEILFDNSRNITHRIVKQ